MVQATRAHVADDEQSRASFAWWRSDWDAVQRHRDGLTIDGVGLRPLVRALGAVTDGILRLLGLRATGESPVTEEEIKVLMEQGAEAGVFEEHEQQLVNRVFRLDEMRVTGVMTPTLTAISGQPPQPVAPASSVN